MSILFNHSACVDVGSVPTIQVSQACFRVHGIDDRFSTPSFLKPSFLSAPSQQDAWLILTLILLEKCLNHI